MLSRKRKKRKEEIEKLSKELLKAIDKGDRDLACIVRRRLDLVQLPFVTAIKNEICLLFRNF